jgi:hypothetical protein
MMQNSLTLQFGTPEIATSLKLHTTGVHSLQSCWKKLALVFTVQGKSDFGHTMTFCGTDLVFNSFIDN